MSVVEKRALKREEVLGLVSLSSATVYRMMSRGEFPRPVRVGRRAARWHSDEVEEWLARDPIASYKNLLLEDGTASEAELQEIDDGAMKEIEEAVDFAAKSPYPDPAELYTDVYGS